eukprot:5976434-Pyramimonas_sp.AAC.1
MHAQTGWWDLVAPCPCPLQQTDSATGEVIMRFVREQMEVPMLDTLQKKCSFAFHCSTCDRGAANLKAENIMASDSVLAS